MANTNYGNIFIQGIRVPIDSVGLFFKDIPLEIEVIPHEGFRFVKWQGVTTADSISQKISLTLSDNTTLEAIFEPEKDLMITEIFYIPASDPGKEFIELYNPKHSTDINLGDYTLDGDIQYTFPSGTKIKAGSYLIVGADSSLYNWCLDAYEWTSGSLGDAEGYITLKDSLGSTLDSVHYINGLPWPAAITDLSIELTDPLLDNNLGASWQLSDFAEGTAGSPKFDINLNNLVLNEFMSYNNEYNFDDNNEFNDWIEIVNTGTDAVDIGGLYITNELDTPAMYQIPTNNPKETVIQPGEHKILWADKDPEQGTLHLDIKLDKQGAAVGISADGKTFIDYSSSIVMAYPDSSYGRYPDVSGDWQIFDAPTPGKLNSLPPEFVSEPQIYAGTFEDYVYDIDVYDPDSDPVLGIHVLPGWLTFDNDVDNPSISGRTPGKFEIYTVKLFATDGYSKPVEQVFKITNNILDVPESLTDNKITVFPNPTDGILMVSAKSESRTLELTVYSVAGQTIMQNVYDNNSGQFKLNIDLSGYETGIYFLNMKLDDEIVIKRILLM
jgi:hypothetical protein